MDSQPKYKNIIPGIPATAVDIYRMLPEGTRCEVIFNELIMSPSPSFEHQSVFIELTAALFHFLKDHPVGTLLTAPFDVYFENLQSVVQPDLFVVMNEGKQIISKNGVHGVPGLVIEIVSTNRAYDTKRKKTLYEKAGVSEYFIIDPINKNVTLFSLDSSGGYTQTYEAASLLKSTLLNCELTF
jgi:Uma2 family endonuclease